MVASRGPAQNRGAAADDTAGGGSGIRSVMVAFLREVVAHDLTQLSAALTYYTVLSLLPALIVIVSLLGMVGMEEDTVHALLDTVGELGAPWAADFVSTALDSVLRSQNSTVVFSLSLVFSLWAASAYVGSFMKASDRIYETAHRRPFWKGVPLRLGLALLLLVLLSVTAAAVTLVGPFGQWVAEATGVGSGPLRLWSWIKWPLLIAVGLLLLALLYEFAPSRRQPALWWLLPGAVVGIALWIVASALFSFYLDNFASYNRVYGTLGAAVAFLVWAWLLNTALLAGVEVNRRMESHRAAARSGAGGGPESPGAGASV